MYLFASLFILWGEGFGAYQYIACPLVQNLG